MFKSNLTGIVNMKNLNKYIKWGLILVLPFLLIMCMSIENIIHPDDPKVNSEIEVSVDLKLVAENDDNTEFVFAVLVPKSWNVAANSTVTYSTTGYTKGDVSDEQMVLISESEKEPTSLLSWPAALQSKVGLMGNLGPVEWVVFKSQTKFIITDEDEKLITSKVKVKLKTGSQNIKFFMGYFFCGKNHGFNEEYYNSNAKSKIMTVTGGTNAMIDYTTVSLVSTVPATFAWGDIFSINFETVAGGVETALNNADKVYLYGKVVYADGNDSTIVDVIGDKTLMEKIGKTTWQKYIYPKEFFNLPNNAVIKEVYFHFTNEDQSIIVKDPTTGKDFQISENCN